MGYTHYWKIRKSNQKTIDQFKKASGLIQELISKEPTASTILTDLVLTDKEVMFNGIDEDSHETFLVTPAATGFDFCKTAAKPYDVFVVASLMILERHVTNFEWSSDGDAEDGDFDDAIELLRKHQIDDGEK